MIPGNESGWEEFDLRVGIKQKALEDGGVGGGGEVGPKTWVQTIGESPWTGSLGHEKSKKDKELNIKTFEEQISDAKQSLNRNEVLKKTMPGQTHEPEYYFRHILLKVSQGASNEWFEKCESESDLR